jgi:hypothetical protein
MADGCVKTAGRSNLLVEPPIGLYILVNWCANPTPRTKLSPNHSPILALVLVLQNSTFTKMRNDYRTL